MMRVIEYLIKDGQIERAVKFAERFGVVDADSRALGQAVRSLSMAGEFDAATIVARRIRQPRTRTETFLFLAEAFGRTGRDASGPLCEASQGVAEISSINEAWPTTGAVFGTAISTIPKVLPLLPFNWFWEAVSG